MIASRMSPKTVRYRDKGTVENSLDTAYNLSNVDTFSDLKWLLTKLSRSRNTSTLNMSRKITYNHSCYTTSVWNRMRLIERRHFQWPWRTRTRFWRSHRFWSRISQMPYVLRTKFLQIINTKPHPVHRMVMLAVTFRDLWPWLQGNASFSGVYVKNVGSWKKSLFHINVKLQITYGTRLRLVTFRDL